MPEMLQNSEGSRSLSEKVRERRSPAFPPHYTTGPDVKHGARKRLTFTP